MARYFIAVKTFLHQIDCFCPGGEHADLLEINQADIIKVTNERKYMMGNGWYFLVEVNNQCCFYMALADLKENYSNGNIFSMFDIELNINYLEYRVNHSLDNADEEMFRNVSKNLLEFNRLKTKLEKFRNNDYIAKL